MKIFTTFTSQGFESAKVRICKEALACGQFERIIPVNEDDLSDELIKSETYHTKKGFGLYSWKAETLWNTLQNVDEGDIVVYCDAGCSLQKSLEWEKLFGYMEKVDILAFRIHQMNYMWTRRSVFDFFKDDIPYNWKENFQCGANCLFVKKSGMSCQFISEWRNLMITRLDLCSDVPKEEMQFEDSRFLENRYDQTILTALIYKYLPTKSVKSIWEHFEGKDAFRSQAICASRKRKKGDLDVSTKTSSMLKRFIKDYIIYPFYGNYIFRKYTN
jgi:hypothetical protein